MSTSEARQNWLEAAKKTIAAGFVSMGYEVPANIRVSIGIPKQRGKGKAIGQCWAATCTSDNHFEIFVSPVLQTSHEVFGTLVHEMVHAVVGLAAGHKGEFKTCALKMGLEGKMTSTTMGSQLTGFCDWFTNYNGHYPAGGLIMQTVKKQATYLLKCECPDCGYTARVTQKWIEVAGAPVCPCNNEPMEVV